MPDSIYDLLDPEWAGQIGIAKPLFGTTASHAVCLFEALGEEQARLFFRGLKDNGVQILSGNKQVAEDVAHGRLAFGLTDTDDAMIELESGFPVRIVYPDSQPNQLGTLFIPNSVCVLKNGPNPDAAKRFLDFLVHPKIEEHLAVAKSAQIPLSPKASVKTLRVETPTSIHAMQVDFAASVVHWEEVGNFLKQEFFARSLKFALLAGSFLDSCFKIRTTNERSRSTCRTKSNRSPMGYRSRMPFRRRM